MAVITNIGQSSFKADMEGAFETIQETRTAMLDEVRSLQLAARVLMLTEAQRLAAEAGADDPRPAIYAAASNSIAQRVAVLDVESQISKLRVAPPARVDAATSDGH